MSAVEVRYHNGNSDIVEVGDATLADIDEAVIAGCLPGKIAGKWVFIPSAAIRYVKEHS